MYFSWYFISSLIVIALLCLVVPSGWFLWYAFLVILGFWSFDAWYVLKKVKIEVKRSFANPAYQHQKTTVTLTVINHSRIGLKIRIKDEPPFAVHCENPTGFLSLDPLGSNEFSYPIVPPKRGLFPFGCVNLRYNGRLSLFTYPIKVRLDDEIEVYPDLGHIGHYHLNHLMGSNLEGPHHRKIFGVGGELVELREFVNGDDYRRINWKVTAHRGKPIINEFEPEKDQNVFLLFDSGRLLYDQVNEENSHFDHILDSAFLLAFNVISRGDMIGAMSFNCNVDRFLPVGKGMVHLQLFVKGFYDLEAKMVESDYREAFGFWQAKAKKRSLIFVYTDLLERESSRELVTHLQLINRHHLVVCVLASHQQLEEVLEQPIATESDAYYKGTAYELLTERTKLKNWLSNTGIKVLEVNSANIRQAVVEHYLFLKERGIF